MKQEKTQSAVKLLTSSMKGCILPLNSEKMTLLEDKHPDPTLLNSDAMYEDVQPIVHPVIFEEISADSVSNAALYTKGGAGPSGLDTDGLRHKLVSRSFGTVSVDLKTEL